MLLHQNRVLNSFVVFILILSQIGTGNPLALAEERPLVRPASILDAQPGVSPAEAAVSARVRSESRTTSLDALARSEGSLQGALEAADVVGHALTVGSGTNVDSAQSVFGGTSGNFSGTDSYLGFSDSADWALGSGEFKDFTIDFRVRFKSLPGVGQYQAFVSQWTPGQKSFTTLLYNDNETYKFIFYYSKDGIQVSAPMEVQINPALDTWYHMAVVRQGSDLSLYVKGAQEEKTYSKTYKIGTDSFLDSTAPLYVGAARPGVHSLMGNLDEVRISKTARWTGNFTSPLSEYTEDANTQLLLHMTQTEFEGTSDEPAFTLVQSIPNRARETNDPDVFYLVNNGKLEIYRWTGSRFYEKRVVNFTESKIVTNSDIQNIQVSEDKKTILVVVRSVVKEGSVTRVENVAYALKLESGATVLKKLVTSPNIRIQGQIDIVQFTGSDILIRTSRGQSYRFDRNSLKEIQSEYFIGVGQNAKVRRYSDGSYEFTYGGTTYQSKENGTIDFGGSVLQIKFGSNKELIGMTLGDGSNIYEDFTFAILNGKVLVTDVKYYNYEGLYIEYQYDAASKKGSQLLYAGYSDRTKPGMTSVHYYSEAADFTNYELLFVANSASFQVNYSELGETKARLDYNQWDELVRFAVLDHGLPGYYVAINEALDLTEQELDHLTDRSPQGIRAALTNDFLIYNPSNTTQTVVASDGQVFSYGLTLYNPAQSEQGGWYFNAVAGMPLVPQVDADGKVILQVPQTGGGTKFYNVLIDDQGTVRLELRDAISSEYVIRGLYEDVMPGYFLVERYDDGSYAINGQRSQNGIVNYKGALFQMQFNAQHQLDTLNVLDARGYAFQKVSFQFDPQTKEYYINKLVNALGDQGSFYEFTLNRDSKMYEHRQVRGDTNAVVRNTVIYYRSDADMADIGKVYFLSGNFTAPWASVEHSSQQFVYADFTEDRVSNNFVVTTANNKQYALLKNGSQFDVTRAELDGLAQDKKNLEGIRNLLDSDSSQRDQFLLLNQQVQVDGTSYVVGVWTAVTPTLTFSSSHYSYQDVDGKLKVNLKGQKFLIVIDNQGIVTLEPHQSPVAVEYKLALTDYWGQPVSVKFYEDGSYDFVYAGQTYHSNSVGVVYTMQDQQHPALRIKIVKNGAGWDLTTLGRENEELTQVSLQVRDGVLVPVAVKQGYDGGGSKTFQFDYAKQSIVVESEYIINSGVKRKVQSIFIPTGLLEKVLYFSSDIGMFLGFQAAEFSYEDGVVKSVRVAEKPILQIGDLDVTWAQVIQLANPSEQAVVALLNDDKQIVISQSVSSGNGKSLEVMSVTLNSITFHQDQAPFESYVTQKVADGKWTLTIPQTEGTQKVYDVLIDNQGIITLVLKTPVVTQQALWLQAEPLMSGLLNFFDPDNVTHESAVSAVSNYHVAIGSIRTQADSLGYKGILDRIDLMENLLPMLVADAGLKRELSANPDSAVNYTVTGMNARLEEFRNLAGIFRTQLQSFPQDAFFAAQDQKFLESLNGFQDVYGKVSQVKISPLTILFQKSLLAEGLTL